MEPQSDKLSFIGSSLSLIAVFIASATPIPLYGMYRTLDGLTYSELSMTAVVYFVGAVSSLLFLGRLSNHWGRKVVTFASLVCGILGCITMLFVNSVEPLLLGRLFQGLSCGLASTAVAAWIVDSSYGIPSWIPPAVISCGPMTGLTFGGITSGALVDYGPMPRFLPYFVVIGVLILCILLVSKGRESMTPKPGALKSLKPEFGLPPTALKAYPAAAVTFVATWALGGFFQAFGPAMAHEQLNSNSAIAAALVFASIMAPSSIGASIAGKMRPERAQLVGMLTFTLFLMGLLLALKMGGLVVFLITSVLAGIAQGGVLTGSIQTMVGGLHREERANVLSVIYATSYTGAAVPTLLAGHFSGQYSLLEVATGYGALAIFASIFVIIAAILRVKAAHAAAN